jgi:hypothetical protein
LLLLDCILLSEFHDDKKKKYRMPIWIPADKSLFLQSTWHSNYKKKSYPSFFRALGWLRALD